MITKLKMFRGQTVSAKWEKIIFNTFYHIKTMKTLIMYNETILIYVLSWHVRKERELEY